jgi:pimeloyl-ACP methyl ester carboxylesterase
VGPPPNFPDGNGSPWIFFVHGYNVGGDKARGFAAEIFKNLYWSQNRAKFVAVSWFGDPYDSTSPVDMVSDYQMAVRNAFTTAPFLARYLNSPTFSGNKTIIGHSLGCMLVSSAIADYGLTVNNAILVDAAVSREAFDGDGDQDYYYMASPAWENLTGGEGNTTATYDRRLWASNWYQRFSSGDARSNLTWLNRLAGANSKIYNFYSSTEDILGATSGSASSGVLSSLWASGFNGQYAWVVQEKAKGNKQSFLDITPIAGSDYGGWGFNVEDAYLPSPYWSTANTTSANTTSLNYAKTSPFFNNGWALFDNDLGGTTLGTIPHTNDYRNLFDPSPGGLATLPYYQLNRFLAEAFPALSLPAGANSVNAVAPSGLGNPGDRNFNMPAKFVPDETHWPRQPVVGGIPDWFHSDMKAVAYPYLYPLYDKFIEISNQ